MTGYMIVNRAGYPESTASKLVYTSLDSLFKAVEEGVKDLNDMHVHILEHSIVEKSDNHFIIHSQWVNGGEALCDDVEYDIVEFTINPPFEM